MIITKPITVGGERSINGFVRPSMKGRNSVLLLLMGQIGNGRAIELLRSEAAKLVDGVQEQENHGGE
jgi:hypothetical protein